MATLHFIPGKAGGGKPLSVDLLKLGTSVVIDFAGNTVADRLRV